MDGLEHATAVRTSIKAKNRTSIPDKRGLTPVYSGKFSRAGCSIGCMNPSTANTSFSARSLAAIKDALAPIRHILDDPSINEIMINGPNNVWIRQSGPDQRLDVELSATQLATAITLLASYVNKESNDKTPILSARFPGFRVEAANKPVALDGPSICIRRHATTVFTLAQYVTQGIVSVDQAALIEQLVHEKKNILIAGGTFSGKTTLMNSILALIPPVDRLFVIEQVAELRLVAPNHVRFECDPDFGVTATKSVKTAMRFSPHRVILGELRGEEGNDWLEAANTGHPGSMATLHANSGEDALKRLASLVHMASNGMPHEAIQDRIGSTVDAVLFIRNKFGERLLSEVCLVKEYDRETGRFSTEVFYHPRTKEFKS